MAFTLNTGQRLEVGDHVYDLAFGWGRVEEAVPQRANVRFTSGSARTATYDVRGVTARFPVRTLYPSQPVIVELPAPENSVRWSRMRSALEGVVVAWTEDFSSGQ